MSVVLGKLPCTADICMFWLHYGYMTHIEFVKDEKNIQIGH